jgi:hypothetical protein
MCCSQRGDMTLITGYSLDIMNLSTSSGIMKISNEMPLRKLRLIKIPS